MYLCVCGRVRLVTIVLLVVPVQLLERECEEAVSTVRAQHEALIKELTAQHQHEVPPLIHILESNSLNTQSHPTSEGGKNTSAVAVSSAACRSRALSLSCTPLVRVWADSLPGCCGS